MSGVQVENDYFKGISRHDLGEPSLQSSIKQYRDLLLCCYRSSNSMVLVQNSVGRETLTNSSVTLIQQLQFLHPCFKFINALIEAQNKTYNLYGDGIGIICSEVLIKSTDLECNGTARSIISDVIDWFSEKVLDHLVCLPDDIVFKIDIGNLDSMIGFIETILNGKQQYFLDHQEVRYLAINIAKAFLQTIPQHNKFNEFGNVQVKTCDISSINESSVLNGIAYPSPEFYNPSILSKILQSTDKHNIVLFNIPLTFETGTEDNLLWSGGGYRNSSFSFSFLDEIKSVLKANCITLVLCQKVVDPTIKYELEKFGIIVLERLGTSLTNLIIKISGCKAISKINLIKDEINESTIGCLDQVEYVEIGSKDYLLFINSCNIITLTIPEKDPHLEEYLKNVIESCFVALRLLAQNPYVVIGGGCLESYLVTYIHQLMDKNTKECEETLDVSPVNVFEVGKMLINIFSTLATEQTCGTSSDRNDHFIHKSNGHLWNKEIDYPAMKMESFNNLSPNYKKDSLCSCNMFNLTEQESTTKLVCIKTITDKSIFSQHYQCLSEHHINKTSINTKSIKCDLYSAKLNAFRLSFEGIIQLLRIGCCLFD